MIRAIASLVSSRRIAWQKLDILQQLSERASRVVDRGSLRPAKNERAKWDACVAGTEAAAQ